MSITELDIELYFIQLLFVKNRTLLARKNRELYDAMLNKYMILFRALNGKVDIGGINERFINDLFKKKGG